MVLYKPRFNCLPTELDVSHNNEGGILAQKEASLPLCN